MAETTTIGAAELEALIAAALVASNTGATNARSVARALTQAEIDGQKGHGLSRVPIYAAQARAGKVDGQAPPIVVALALSQVARGKILTASQKGEPIPAGWAVDEHGSPTTDAKLALKGALQPIGGAKGAALALMVEILAVALTGAVLSSEAS